MSAKKEVLSWVKTIALAIVLALCINNFIIVNAKVPTGSMEPTIMAGDRIIASRWSYWVSSPERGDIVIFRYPDDESTLYVKRVIGLPGETVEVIDGKVYIDGELLQEDYLENNPEIPLGNYGPYEVPEDHYFMMGDNRNHSLDSRFWDNKYVEEGKILGKAQFKYWPELEVVK